jgi:hypothetical protein
MVAFQIAPEETSELEGQIHFQAILDGIPESDDSPRDRPYTASAPGCTHTVSALAGVDPHAGHPDSAHDTASTSTSAVDPLFP